MPESLSSDIQLRSASTTDLDAILAIRRSPGKTDLTVKQLQASWQSLDMEKQTQVATRPNGDVIGYAELWQHRPDVFIPLVWVRDDEQRHGIGTALLRHMEVQARVLVSEGSCKLLSQPWQNEIAVRHLLEKVGYVCSSTFQRMELHMVEPPSRPATIPGIEIRSIKLEQDELAVYKADEEAFLDERGKKPRTLEQWRRRFQMHTDHFDPTLWWVAWAGSEIAGTSMNEVDNSAGEVMHLGVRRPWRKRGLGTTLLQIALHEFYRRNVHIMRLNVDAQSLTNAHLLYKRLGFRTVNAYMNYFREI